MQLYDICLYFSNDDYIVGCKNVSILHTSCVFKAENLFGYSFRYIWSIKNIQWWGVASWKMHIFVSRISVSPRTIFIWIYIMNYGVLKYSWKHCKLVRLTILYFHSTRSFYIIISLDGKIKKYEHWEFGLFMGKWHPLFIFSI